MKQESARAAFRGVLKMRKLAKVILAGAIWLAMAGSVSAAGPVPPFVKILVSQKALDLGTIWGPGPERVGATLNARVVSNCSFLLSASFRGFVHEQGKAAIAPEHLWIFINEEHVGVGDKSLVAESKGPTPSSGVDVPIDLHVGIRAIRKYPAGHYNGMLVLTVMAGP